MTSRAMPLRSDMSARLKPSFVIYGATYLLNQRAVRVQLDPRRQDLLKLVASLENETNSEDSNDVIDLVSAFVDPVGQSGRRTGIS